MLNKITTHRTLSTVWHLVTVQNTLATNYKSSDGCGSSNSFLSPLSPKLCPPPCPSALRILPFSLQADPTSDPYLCDLEQVSIHLWNAVSSSVKGYCPIAIQRTIRTPSALNSAGMQWVPRKVLPLSLEGPAPQSEESLRPPSAPSASNTPRPLPPAQHLLTQPRPRGLAWRGLGIQTPELERRKCPRFTHLLRILRARGSRPGVRGPEQRGPRTLVTPFSDSCPDTHTHTHTRLHLFWGHPPYTHTHPPYTHTHTRLHLLGTEPCHPSGQT